MRVASSNPAISVRRDVRPPSAQDSTCDRYIRSGSDHRQSHIPDGQYACSALCGSTRTPSNIYPPRR
jgi:hypothetical protein